MDASVLLVKRCTDNIKQSAMYIVDFLKTAISLALHCIACCSNTYPDDVEKLSAVKMHIEAIQVQIKNWILKAEIIGTKTFGGGYYSQYARKYELPRTSNEIRVGNNLYMHIIISFSVKYND